MVGLFLWVPKASETVLPPVMDCLQRLFLTYHKRGIGAKEDGSLAKVLALPVRGLESVASNPLKRSGGTTLIQELRMQRQGGSRSFLAS